MTQQEIDLRYFDLVVAYFKNSDSGKMTEASEVEFFRLMEEQKPQVSQKTIDMVDIMITDWYTSKEK